MERKSPRKKSGRSRSPSRVSPKKMETYLQQARDPLMKIMTSYLNRKDLNQMSKTSKIFNTISKPELKKIYISQSAKKELERFIPIDNYDLLTPQEKLNARLNISNQIDIYKIIYEDDPSMKQVINKMIKIYEKISKQKL